ncbi:MAG: hypothetical protein U1F43_31535 [Myxococcota bacterium]
MSGDPRRARLRRRLAAAARARGGRAARLRLRRRARRRLRGEARLGRLRRGDHRPPRDPTRGRLADGADRLRAGRRRHRHERARPRWTAGAERRGHARARAGATRTAAEDLAPTWVAPLYLTPFDLGETAFLARASPPGEPAGAALEATAGRVWAHARGGGGAIVESNSGRTFLDGFAWDDFPYDTDGDGRVDMAALVANQLSAACSRARADDGAAAPEVSNLPDDAVAVVPNDLVIVRGVADDATVVTSRAGDAARAWPVADRRWKALVPLAPGDNWVSFASDAGDGRSARWTHLQIRYEPQTNPRTVRFVYAIAQDGDGRFDAPPGEPSSSASATARIALGGRLLQAMVADRLAEAGLDRRTFRLEPGGVTVWRTSLPTATWWSMSGLAMFSWLWDHLAELPPCAACKTVVILGMTHWDAAQGKALAHTALGGGGLAVFGSGTLHTWAAALDDVPARLEDATSMAALGLMDDSGFRDVAWANYATGLGAVLHELGHALDLPHPVDSASIMNRGFDHVNRLLVASEPPSATSSGLAAIWPNDEPSFDFTGVHRLRWQRWLALVDRAYSVDASPTINVDADAAHVHSDAGVRVVAYARLVGDDWRAAGGEVRTDPSAPLDVDVSLANLRFVFPSEPSIRLFVTDDQGNERDDVIVPLR